MAEQRPEWKKGSSSIPKQVFHEVPETLETLKARVRKVGSFFQFDAVYPFASERSASILFSEILKERERLSSYR
jgi:hypothetical protein